MIKKVKAYGNIDELPAGYKVVNIKCLVCCGCGCIPIGIKYMVPEDSQIKDGDTLTRGQIDEDMVIE